MYCSDSIHCSITPMSHTVKVSWIKINYQIGLPNYFSNENGISKKVTFEIKPNDFWTRLIDNINFYINEKLILNDNQFDLSQSVLSNEPIGSLKFILENYEFNPITSKDLVKYEIM